MIRFDTMLALELIKEVLPKYSAAAVISRVPNGRIGGFTIYFRGSIIGR